MPGLGKCKKSKSVVALQIQLHCQGVKSWLDWHTKHVRIRVLLACYRDLSGLV